MKTFTIDGNTYKVSKLMSNLISQIRNSPDTINDDLVAEREALYQELRDEVFEITGIYEDDFDDEEYVEVVQDWTYDEMLDMVWENCEA